MGDEMDHKDLLQEEHDPFHTALGIAMEATQASLRVQSREQELLRENHRLRCERDAWVRFYERAAETNARLNHENDIRRQISLEQDALLERLREQLWLPREPGQHDYHGPTKPNAEGRPEPVPDPVHERFHGAVGDVLAGKIIPAARRQMQEALKNAPKDAPPFPVGSSKDDPKRIGWRMNDAV